MNRDPSDDHDLVERSRQGDKDAFGKLVRLHQDRLYRFLLHMLGSREEALEIAQEAFLKAWLALPQWQPQARFGTWLFRIAANAATDALRRRKTVSFAPLPEEMEIAEPGAGPAEQLAARRALVAVDQALARLPAEQREALLLKEVEDMSYEEIGEVLDIGIGTVKSRISRAREALLRHSRGGEGARQ